MCEKCAAIVDLIEAECGKESTGYVHGLMGAAAKMVANLLRDPDLGTNPDVKLAAWIAVAMEAGLAVGMKQPKFTQVLLGALHYGRQITDNHATTASAETLEEDILTGLTQQEFGWDKEKE